LSLPRLLMFFLISDFDEDVSDNVDQGHLDNWA